MNLLMSLSSQNIKFNIKQIDSGIVSPEVYPVSSNYPIANGTTKRLNLTLYIYFYTCPTHPKLSERRSNQKVINPDQKTSVSSLITVHFVIL